MKMLPVAVPLVATSPTRGRAALTGTAAMTDSATPPATPRDAGEPDWQSAYQRRRDEDTPAEPANPDAPPSLLGVLPAPVLPLDAPAVPEVRPASATPMTTATADRIDAVRELVDANAATATPVARTWQVELPGTGSAWQLHVAQAQPQAPLNLELRVPPVAQSQARQQLSDLDKRLRDAGHDVLRPRVRSARGSQRALPTDEVTP